MVASKKTATAKGAAGAKTATAKGTESAKTASVKGAAGVETALPVSTAAFKHGASAYGARFVKKGFGFDEQEDLEWALGWPHVQRLIDGHPLDADPASWEKYFSPFPKFQMDFPRELAARWIRLHLFCPETPEEADDRWTKLAKKYTEIPGPITEKEARSVISQHLKPVEELWWVFNFPETILLIEAFVGPDVVAETLVETVEACPPDVLKSSDRPRSDCVSLLGFLLLRLPVPRRNALEQRLRKVLDAVVATIPGGIVKAGARPFQTHRSLDRVLNGKEAALRSGPMMLTDLLFSDDDPGFIVELLRGRSGPGANPPLARLVFLAGDGVLDVETQWWSKYTEPEKDVAQRTLVRDYGRIRSEKMLPILLAMSQSSKARKEAAAWFAAHAAYARPYLERTAAGKGDAAAGAKALLG